MNKNNTINDVELAGVAALAAASKTPFKTAFKVTLGIALGQVVVGGGFLLSFVLLGLIIYLGIR